MFHLRLQIENPFHNDWSSTVDWFFRDWRLSKNKILECQIGHWSKLHSFIDVDITTVWNGRDHAGPSFELTILWFYAMVKIYDKRHWNYDKGEWETYDEISIK